MIQHKVPTLAWTCGLPGSGKTTFSKRLAEAGWVHISRDAIRDEFGPYSPLVEIDVVGVIEHLVKGHLKNYRSVVIDNVNNEIWQRTRYAGWGKDVWDVCALKHRKVCFYFPCDLEIALARRQEKIAEEPELERFMKKQAEDFVVPSIKEGFHVFTIDAHKTDIKNIMEGPMLPFEHRDLRV